MDQKTAPPRAVQSIDRFSEPPNIRIIDRQHGLGSGKQVEQRQKQELPKAFFGFSESIPGSRH